MISGIIFIGKKDEMGAQVGVSGCLQQYQCVLVQAEAAEDLLSYSHGWEAAVVVLTALLKINLGFCLWVKYCSSFFVS